MTIGASITCGNSAKVEDEDRPGGSKSSHIHNHYNDNPDELRLREAYPKYLERYLNTMYACDSKTSTMTDDDAKHVVNNLCVIGGISGFGGTSFWNERIAQQRKNDDDIIIKSIKQSDVIIIDSSINDVPETNSEILKMQTELLIRSIYDLNKEITIIYIGGYFKIILNMYKP